MRSEEIPKIIEEGRRRKGNLQEWVGGWSKKKHDQQRPQRSCREQRIVAEQNSF